MSNPGDADSTPITSLQQLADYFAAGCKPAERFRIGTEHEKFGFRLADLAAPPYQPSDGQPGSIRGLLEGLQSHFAGIPITDAGNVIGLKQGDAAISLEPAGQLELSGAPLETLHDTAAELEAHYDQARAVSRELQIGFAPLGFHPTATREQMPWMPKGRYAIMRRYMPKVGTLGLDMMTRTCTVQVNLDYASEEDMVRKLRVSLLLQPVATALFANSPFTEGQPNGFLSYRAYCWTDTDNRRSGIPRVMFEPGFGFERYAEWLVNEVPMYFVYRDGRYVDVAGVSFRDFMAGRSHNSPGLLRP
jgi:glutamate--cysteine ligase